MNTNSPIQHVVVLMLENNSFDRMLGSLQSQQHSLAGIPADGLRQNLVDGKIFQQFAITQGDVHSITFDPGHEYTDAIAQLGRFDRAKDAFPMDGFAKDAYEQLPSNRDANAQSAMQYFCCQEDSGNQTLPILQGLASHYAICDHWFSSVPGPTLPNRFFATHGTAFGEVLMPGKLSFADITLGLELLAKSKTENSIFSLCDEHAISSSIYCAGVLPFCAFSNGVSPDEIKSLLDFEADCLSGKLVKFSWIEPDYAFLGGVSNSQHPPHDPVHGEWLIWKIYQSLKSSPQWERTLFVITYDENGGFYDHVSPPSAPAPDKRRASRFKRYGARVPAVLISPQIKSCSIDPTVYDHTSLLAYLCDLFGFERQLLGNRVKLAQHFGDAPIWHAADGSALTPDLALTEPSLPEVLPSNAEAKWEQLGDVLAHLISLHQRGVRHKGWLAGTKSMVARVIRFFR